MRANSEQGLREGAIYTLAESETAIHSPAAIVNGDGTVVNSDTMRNRAKRKTITLALILSLIDVAKEKGAYDRMQSYWNTYHCLNGLIIKDGLAYSNYCKNRSCTICCANRKADMINRYYPVLKTWGEVYFVTLTVKAVPANLLISRIDETLNAFTKVKNRLRKRHLRRKSPRLMGIRALECNFNPIHCTYNPHFHILVRGYEMANAIKQEWLSEWGETNAKHYCQKILRVRDLEKHLIETIKYGSKVFTEPQNKGKKVKGMTAKIYANAIDNIIVAMKGRRIFDRFGFNL